MSSNERNGRSSKPKLNSKLRKQVSAKDRPIMKIDALSSLDKQGFVKAIVETPKGSRNKYKYDPELGLFECAAALQAGLTYPFDFGFVPSTLAEDGDPLDVLILMDEPSFAGCLVHTRIIGVIEAEQIEEGQKQRNDRLIGVHTESINYGEYTTWQELPKKLRQQIELFFDLLNQTKDRPFKILGWKSPKTAYALLSKAVNAKTKGIASR